ILLLRSYGLLVKKYYLFQGMDQSQPLVKKEKIMLLLQIPCLV
ncbi:uncharacterized protein METZ01_LOCUS288572, partial [marine metagenome]